MAENTGILYTSSSRMLSNQKNGDESSIAISALFYIKEQPEYGGIINARGEL